MTVYLQEDWYENYDGYYPVGAFNGATTAYSSPSWNDPSTGFTSQWAWANDVAVTWQYIEANKLTYPGYYSTNQKLRLLSKSDGQHWPYLQRDLASSWIDTHMPKGRTYWFSFLTSVYFAKEDLRLGINGLSTDPADSTIATVFYHSHSTPAVTDPSVARSDTDTPCFIGDSTFTTHCIVLKLETGQIDDLVNITTWCDPDLSKDPTQWGSYEIGQSGGLYCKTALKGLKFWSGRASSNTTPYSYFDAFRIASTWYEAVGQSESASINAWPMFFWKKFL